MRHLAGRWRSTAVGAALAAATLGGCQHVTALGRPPCQDRVVHIYFETDSVTVTKEARAVLAQASAIPKACRIDRVDVLGLADATGAPEHNLELSKRRAQSVTAALADANLPAGEFAIAAAGQTGSVTPSGAAQPVRRRVDVVLRLSPQH
ncbi:OmpA family protein [Phenylobacterium sp.]|uniref:OmpA family protein n=1 Tax=Phenylobacterium sp. TaxID=1871053 RepID=UPI0035AEA7D4